MILKTKFLKKIFSLKFKPINIFSNKESPTDRYAKLIDSYITELKNPKKEFPNFKDDIIKMNMIQFDEAEDSLKRSKESDDPIAKLKAFTDKMNANLDEEDDDAFAGNPFSSKKQEKKQEKKMEDQNENEKEDEDDEEEESDSFDESESNSLFVEEKPGKNLKNENYDDMLKQFEKKDEKKKQKSDEESSSSEESNEKSDEKKAEAEKKAENLFEKDGKYFEGTSQGLDFIPENLIIKTLIFPKNNSEVLLLGVEKRNESHASFMLGFLF